MNGGTGQQDLHRDDQRAERLHRRTGDDASRRLYTTAMHWGAVLVPPGYTARCARPLVKRAVSPNYRNYLAEELVARMTGRASSRISLTRASSRYRLKRLSVMKWQVELRSARKRLITHRVQGGRNSLCLQPGTRTRRARVKAA